MSVEALQLTWANLLLANISLSYTSVNFAFAIFWTNHTSWSTSFKV